MTAATELLSPHTGPRGAAVKPHLDHPLDRLRIGGHQTVMRSALICRFQGPIWSWVTVGSV